MRRPTIQEKLGGTIPGSTARLGEIMEYTPPALERRCIRHGSVLSEPDWHQEHALRCLERDWPLCPEGRHACRHWHVVDLTGRVIFTT